MTSLCNSLLPRNIIVLCFCLGLLCCLNISSVKADPSEKVTAAAKPTQEAGPLINKIDEQPQAGAQSEAQARGDSQHHDNQMEAMDSMQMMGGKMMPDLGGMMQQTVAQKQKMLQDLSKRKMQATEQFQRVLQTSMDGMRMRSSGRMQNMAGMMGSMQNQVLKGGQDIKNQLRQSLHSSMGRMEGLSSIGQNMMGSVQRVTQTLGEGVAETMNSLQKTGQKVRTQLRNDMSKNTNMMSNMMDSMHGSMGNMGQNMQKNLMGLVGGVSGAMGQLSSQFQKAASAPMELIQNLGQMKGQMMGGSGGGSSGGRY